MYSWSGYLRDPVVYSKLVLKYTLKMVKIQVKNI